MQFLLIVHGVKGMWKPIECMTHVTFASWLPVRVVAFFLGLPMYLTGIELIDRNLTLVLQYANQCCHCLSPTDPTCVLTYVVKNDKLV